MLCFSILAVLSLFCSTVAAVGAGNVTTDQDGYAPLWVKEPYGRGTWSIVYSALVTIVLCSWTAFHFSVPKPKEKRIQKGWRYIFLTTRSVLLPEWVVIIAIFQWWEMRCFRNAINKVAAKQHEERSSGDDNVPGLREAYKPYSSEYAWFASMGGVAVDVSGIHNDLDRATLSTSGLMFLARHGHFANISDDEISDKSKADYLAKTLVSFQVFWFVCQVIERWIEGLPTSLLEFRTLVNIGGALTAYLIWWKKPLNINVPLIMSGEGVEELVAVLLFQNSIAGCPHQHLVSGARKRPPEIPHESHLWCWTEDNQMVLVERLPYNLTRWVVPGTGVHIGPCMTRPNKWYDLRGTPIPPRVPRLLPLADSKVIRKLPERSSAPRSSAASDSAFALSNPKQAFHLGLSAKDERRIELVRKYILANLEDNRATAMRHHDASQRCWHRAPVHFKDEVHYVRRRPALDTLFPDNTGRVESSSATTGSLDMESQACSISLDECSYTACAWAHYESHDIARPCWGHDKSTHIPVDELPCFHHTYRPGLLVSQRNEWGTVFDYGKAIGRINTRRVHRQGVVITFASQFVAGVLHLIPVYTSIGFSTLTEKMAWHIICWMLVGLILICGVFSFIPFNIVRLWYHLRRRISRRGTEQVQLDVFMRDFYRSKFYRVSFSLLFVVFYLAKAFLFIEPFVALRHEKEKIFWTPMRNWLSAHAPHF